MNSKERELFGALCSFKQDNFDESLLEYASPEVLGQLFYNRMAAIAYGVLKRHQLLGKVNREFRNSLKCAYDANVEKNKYYNKCLEFLTRILGECNCDYAMLKGAVLCSSYPVGYRTSNDVDLLVRPKDVTQVGETLARHGFRQGYVRNETFIPATRAEIIQSKMMRGETVPYIKEMDLPGMKYLEVDINFSLDYKNGDEKLLDRMLNRARLRILHDMSVTTLDFYDFLIHLCMHLYKEATTLPWVEMKRDMTLYKYCDIYMILSNMSSQVAETFFICAYELRLEKICAFAVLQTAMLFDLKNSPAVEMANMILRDDPDFMHTVISPTDNLTFIYSEKNIAERFFASDRTSLLAEVRDK